MKIRAKLKTAEEITGEEGCTCFSGTKISYTKEMNDLAKENNFLDFNYVDIPVYNYANNYGIFVKKEWLKDIKINYNLENFSIYFYDPKKENGYLSNFYPSEILIDNNRCKTVEHYYQSMKFEGSNLFRIILDQPTAYIVKDLAYLSKPINWTIKRKVMIMRKALIAKFTQNIDLYKKLIDTGDSLIVEASKSDSFWGEGSDGNGINMMGLLLMEVRNILKNQ